jgi:hypothetical protein
MAVDADSALLHLRRFTALDTRGVGRLTYDELRQGLGVKDSPEMVDPTHPRTGEGGCAWRTRGGR